jgi:hypothetical protein
VDSKDAVYLSTLLSNLVDQAKQGYIFTWDDWARFKGGAIKGVPRVVPFYKKGELDANAPHIIDRLMFVAHRAIESARTEFHKSMGKTSSWDDSLAAYARWAQNEALGDPEWADGLHKLKADIKSVRATWSEKLGAFQNEEMNAIFGPALAECYERFQAIQPANDTPLTRTLLESWHCNADLSRWALLQASFAYGGIPKWHASNFVWWMAGTQLCHIKATTLGGMVAMAPRMNAMLRPDSTFVKLRLSEEKVYQWVDDNNEKGGIDDYDDDD